MNLSGKMKLVGALLLVAFIMAPLAMANLSRVNPGIGVTVHNVSGGPNYSAIKVADANGTVLVCGDTDGGFNPTSKGAMDVNFSDRNGTSIYGDYCLDANTLIEFACGKDVNVNGGIAQNNNAYTFKFNCLDLNKTCSLGRCV